MPTRRMPIIRMWTGSAWSDPVLPVGMGGQAFKAWYSPLGKVWQLEDLPDLAPNPPTALTCPNIGQTTRSINMSWTAPEGGADSYILRSQHWEHTTTATAINGITFGENMSASMNVYAVKNGLESGPSNTITVISGQDAKSIAAGSMYIRNGVVSVNRFRQGTWGYGGSNQPYIGWYSNQAYRYTSFFEIPNWTIRNSIVAQRPDLNGYWGHIGCTAAGIFFSRASGVGNFNNTLGVQVSLGNGISYASGAEPPAQGNIFDFNVYPVANGHVGYSMPPNWFQAIYQDHASYNGLLFRPYRNNGARIDYMAFNANPVEYDVHLSWGNIVTQHATMSRYG